jgi:hypothetical protein
MYIAVKKMDKPVDAVGEVRQFNRSLYVLLPQKIAQEMNITVKTRWQLTKNGQALLYRFIIK